MKNNTIIMLILIILIILISDIKIKEKFEPKKKLWMYWENIDNKPMPPYIDLCIYLAKKNANQYFDVVILNEKNIYNYITDLRSDINDLPIALKTDYIRVKLLYEYGGLWVDADTIIMNNLYDIYLKLNDYDYIGFGCTGNKCIKTAGYGKPSNGVMGSKKHGQLMKKCLAHLDDKLKIKKEQYNYFELGKYIIWEELDILIKSHNYVYYHYDSECDGTRDKYGTWVAPHIINEIIEYSDMNKILLVMLANSIYCGNDEKYNWFCKEPIHKILSGTNTINILFNKALKMCNKLDV
jgi:hypothetical protein